MNWISLPFPRCVSCHRTYVRSYHRNCTAKGEILVEPYARKAKCSKCKKQWQIMNTTFYCSCGYVFHATDVEDALSTIALVKNRLIKQIQSLSDAEDRITEKSQESLRRWLGETSYEVGKHLGKAAAYFKRLLDDF